MSKKNQNLEDEDPTPYLFVSLEQRRIDQSKPYDSKKNCWVPDEKEGYLLGEIKATKGDIVTVQIPGGEVNYVSNEKTNFLFQIIQTFIPKQTFDFTDQSYK